MSHPVRFLTRAFLLVAFVSAAIAQSKPEEEPLVKMVNRAYHAVVNISTSRGVGSGFFINAEGHVITNSHVVEGALTRLNVLTQDGQSLKARIVGRDEAVDIALLKVEGTAPFTFISLDKLSPNMLGQTMVVMGNPRGLGTSVSRGILSARGRSIDTGDRAYENLLQTDAAINPGNSGGPILDLAGQLSGVTQLRRQGADGLSFAISAEVVRDKARELIGKDKK
jgi:serine protease Do